MDLDIEQRRSPLPLQEIACAIRQYFGQNADKGDFSISYWDNFELDTDFEPGQELPLTASLLRYADHHGTLDALAGHIEPVGCALNYSYFSSGKRNMKARIVNITLLKSLVAKGDIAIAAPQYEYEVGYFSAYTPQSWALGMYAKAFAHIGM